MAPQPVAGALDLDDDGVVEEATHPGSTDALGFRLHLLKGDRSGLSGFRTLLRHGDEPQLIRDMSSRCEPHWRCQAGKPIRGKYSRNAKDGQSEDDKLLGTKFIARRKSRHALYVAADSSLGHEHCGG